MQIGNLRERLTLQQRVETDDPQGGAAVSWTTVGTDYAEVKPNQGGTERLQQQQIVATSLYTVTVRRRSDVSATMRWLWQPDGTTHTLEILSTAYSPDHEWLVMACAEVQT